MTERQRFRLAVWIIVAVALIAGMLIANRPARPHGPYLLTTSPLASRYSRKSASAGMAPLFQTPSYDLCSHSGSQARPRNGRKLDSFLLLISYRPKTIH
jgi:hypothetical protein